MKSYAYNLTSTNAGSDKYGNCEVCSKKADTVYHLIQMAEYLPGRMTRHQCGDWFGHKSCLSAITHRARG